MTNLAAGNCVSAPTCTKIIPIYPLRYAVMPSKTSDFLYDTKFSKNLDSSFPLLPETAYCLRNLRDKGYVYIYDPNARKREQWNCYQYNGNVGSPAPVPGFYKLKINPKDASLEATSQKARECIEQSMHEHTPNKIYMIYIDSPLTKDTMEKVESGKLKSKIMQEIDVSSWIDAQDAQWKADKTFIKKAPAAVKHGIVPGDLLHWNKDCDDKLSMQWSENPAKEKVTFANISSAMYRLNSLGGMAVALYDAVGMASELSQLVNYEVKQLKANSEITARKQWVSDTIDGLTKQAGRRAYSEAGADAVSHAIVKSGGYGVAMLRAQATIRKAREHAEYKTIKDYNESHRYNERQAFIKNLPKQRQRVIDQIKAAGRPHLTWIQYTGDGSFTNALLAYDVKDRVGFLAYQGAVARSVDGLLLTKDGSQYVANLLPASGPVGLFEKALKGHPDIVSYLSKNASGRSQFNVKEKMAALKKLSIQPTQASRHLSLIVVNNLFQHTYFRKHPQFLASEYRLMLEIAEGNAIGKQEYNTEDLPNLMLDATASGANGSSSNLSGSTNKFIIKVSSRLATTTSLYFLGETENPFMQNIPASKQQLAAKQLNFWHNMKVGISGLATALSALNIQLTIKDFSDEDKNVLITSLSLATGLLAAGAGTATTVEAVFSKRATLTKIESIQKYAEEKALVYERIALGFALAASLTAAFNSIFFKTTNSSTASSKVLYGTSGIAHAAVAGQAFYKLMSVSDKAFATRATAAITTKIGGRAAGYLLGPQAALIMLGIEAIAFALEKWAEAQEKAKEVTWIEHSIWGTEPNKQWTAKKEQYEILKLFIKPTIMTDFNTYSNGNLFNEDAVIQLPGFKPQVSRVEIRKSGDIIRKKPVSIKDANGTRVIKYKTLEYYGDIDVKYWPNKFAEPNTFYTATTD